MSILKGKMSKKPGLFCRFCYDNNVVTVSLMAAGVWRCGMELAFFRRDKERV